MPAKNNYYLYNKGKAFKRFPVKREPSLLEYPYKVITTPFRNKKRYRRRATETIGVVVHELQSDFIVAALAGMEREALQQGYKLVITHSQERMEKEVANVRMLFEHQVDGLIASLSFDTTNLDHFNSFAHRGGPVVFFDRVAKGRGSTAIVIDNIGAGYTATKHLIDQGCKRIAIVTSCLERNVYVDRYTGYRRALNDHGISFTDQWLILNDIRREAGIEAAQKLLAMKERPDGLFITNDTVAAACMQTLMDKGIQVPDEMAVVGFNNDSICKLTMPTITTINYPGMEMGRLAAAALINNIRGTGNFIQPETSVVSTDLIVRNSSLKISR
jgi:LacI family transcriptional regulator